MFENPLTHEERARIYNDGNGLAYPFEITCETQVGKDTFAINAKTTEAFEQAIFEAWRNIPESDKSKSLAWEEKQKERIHYRGPQAIPMCLSTTKVDTLLGAVWNLLSYIEVEDVQAGGMFRVLVQQVKDSLEVYERVEWGNDAG